MRKRKKVVDLSKTKIKSSSILHIRRVFSRGKGRIHWILNFGTQAKNKDHQKQRGENLSKCQTDQLPRVTFIISNR